MRAMGFVALIFALLIEQGRPLPRDNFVHRAVVALADAVRRTTDAGEARLGVLGWFVLIGTTAALVLLVDWALGRLSPVAVFAFHVAVLYWTMGFRQFSHAFSEIQQALAEGDVQRARETLRAWLRERADDVPGRPRATGERAEAMPAQPAVDEMCRLAIGHALVRAHRHVFAPLFWYVLLPGPVGPVVYRMADLLARRWSRDEPPPAGTPASAAAVLALAEQPAGPYGRFAVQAWRALDWLPLRLTAAGFAVVGNFEDAVFCWRGASAAGVAADARGLLLATGGGALGLRLADPAMEAQWLSRSGFEWQGTAPDASSLRSAVGLVWRSVVLWIGLFALLTVATWLGR